MTRLLRTVVVLACLLMPSVSAAQALPSAVCDAVRAEFAASPENLWPTRCRLEGDPACPLGEILNRVAWQFRADGFGLSRKDFGYFVSSPAGPVASDILQRGTVIWDVVTSDWRVACGDGEDTLHVWDASYRASRPFVAPVAPGGSPDPKPDPNATAPLLKRIAELEALLADAVAWSEQYRDALNHAVEAQREATAAHDAAVAQRDELQRRLDALLAEPAPRCEAKILGIKIPCKVIR